MRRLRLGFGSLAVTLGLVGCGPWPALPTHPENVAISSFKTQQAPGAIRRIVRCDRQGAASIAENQAERMVRQAIQRYNLQPLTDRRDIRRAERDLAQFLIWKLGGPNGFCREYAESGHRGLRRDFNEEAAAFLLGVLRFRGDSPVVVMPEWFQDFVLARTRGRSQRALTGTLRDLGLSRRMAFLLAQQISDTRPFGPDRAIVRLTPRVDLERPFVHAAIQAKQRQRLGRFDRIHVGHRR